MNKPTADFEESRPFLEDAENKLIALRDLYKQELIDAEVYIRKTDDIANSITKKIGAGIHDIAFEKKNQIYNQLKFDIVNKVKQDLGSKKSSNLDSLISAVDKRIEQGFENEKANSDILDKVKETLTSKDSDEPTNKQPNLEDSLKEIDVSNISKKLKENISNKKFDLEKPSSEQILNDRISSWLDENAEKIAREVLKEEVRKLFK